MQIIAHNKDGTVTTYHTIKSREGSAGFECVGTVKLADCSTDKEGRVVVVCPNAGCPGNESGFPLAGDTEAQRLHAHVRLVNPKHPTQTLPDAIESVLGDVAEKGGLPSAELATEALIQLGNKPNREKQPVLFFFKEGIDGVKKNDEPKS